MQPYPSANDSAKTFEGHDNCPDSYTKDLPLVSIVILNCNGLTRLQACLNAVLEQRYKNIEIVFVDNGSSDGSAEWAAEKLAQSPHPHRIEKLGTNLGINRGKNLGAAVAHGSYLWLLDNDVAPEPSTLAGLVSYMEDNNDVALCGPVLTAGASGDIIGGGFRLKPLYRPARPLRATEEGHARGQPVTYVSGGAMLVRASVWRQLGGFEDSAHFYLDDSDFGVRCWLAGHRVALVPSTTASHLVDAPLSRQQRRQRFGLHITGVTRFILRNFSPVSMLAHLSSFEVFLLLRTIKYTIRYRHPSFVLDYLQSQYHCIRHAVQTMAERKAIQQDRKISTDVFLHLGDNQGG